MYDLIVQMDCLQYDNPVRVSLGSVKGWSMVYDLRV